MDGDQAVMIPMSKNQFYFVVKYGKTGASHISESLLNKLYIAPLKPANIIIPKFAIETVQSIKDLLHQEILKNGKTDSTPFTHRLKPNCFKDLIGVASISLNTLGVSKNEEIEQAMSYQKWLSESKKNGGKKIEIDSAFSFYVVSGSSKIMVLSGAVNKM